MTTDPTTDPTGVVRPVRMTAPDSPALRVTVPPAVVRSVVGEAVTDMLHPVAEAESTVRAVDLTIGRGTGVVRGVVAIDGPDDDGDLDFVDVEVDHGFVEDAVRGWVGGQFVVPAVVSITFRRVKSEGVAADVTLRP